MSSEQFWALISVILVPSIGAMLWVRHTATRLDGRMNTHEAECVQFRKRIEGKLDDLLSRPGIDHDAFEEMRRWVRWNREDMIQINDSLPPGRRVRMNRS